MKRNIGFGVAVAVTAIVVLGVGAVYGTLWRERLVPTARVVVGLDSRPVQDDYQMKTLEDPAYKGPRSGSLLPRSAAQRPSHEANLERAYARKLARTPWSPGQISPG